MNLHLDLSDGSTLDICPTLRDLERRMVYRWTVTGPDGTVLGTDADLRSGVGFPVDLPAMASSFASFVGAYAEAGDDSENADLFPAVMREWCEANADELYCLTDLDPAWRS